MPTRSNAKNPIAVPGSKQGRPERELELYVSTLEQENLKLQHRIAKLEVDLLSARNRIAALEKAKPSAVIRNMTDEQIEERLAAFARSAGYVKGQKR